MADRTAPRDAGAFIPGIGAASNADNGEYVELWANPTTHRLLVDATGTLAAQTEDTAHTTGDIGAMMLAVRNDTLASLVDTDGDYAPLQVNASGALYVDIVSVSADLMLGTDFSAVFGSSNIIFNEDAVHTTADPGIQILGVRNDTLAALAGTDGDYTPFQMNASGAVYVEVATSALPSGAATAANQTTIIGHVDGIEALLTTIDADTSTINTNLATVAGAVTGTEMQVDVVAALPAGANTIGDVTISGAALTALQLIDDAVAVLGTATYTEATTSGFVIGAVRNDTLAALANTDNEIAPLQVNASGALYVEVATSALPSGAATAANQTTIIGHVDGIEALLTTIDADTSTLAGAVAGTEMQVDLVAITPDLMLGTDFSAVFGSSSIVSNAAAQVTGDEAHDAADAGNPVKIGYKAINLGANPTAVAADDRTDGYANRHGIPFVQPGHPNTLTASLNVSDADGAQTDTAIITVAASVAIVVTMVQVYLDEATTAGTQVRIGFGTANTPALDAAGVILSRSGIPPGGGAVAGTGAGIVGQGASNEDLRITCADPAGGNLDVIVTYYTIAI